MDKLRTLPRLDCDLDAGYSLALSSSESDDARHHDSAYVTPRPRHERATRSNCNTMAWMSYAHLHQLVRAHGRSAGDMFIGFSDKLSKFAYFILIHIRTTIGPSYADEFRTRTTNVQPHSEKFGICLFCNGSVSINSYAMTQLSSTLLQRFDLKHNQRAFSKTSICRFMASSTLTTSPNAGTAKFLI